MEVPEGHKAIVRERMKAHQADPTQAIDFDEALKQIKAEAEEIKLSETEKKIIEEGLEDVKQGRVYSSKQANELLRNWLGQTESNNERK